MLTSSVEAVCPAQSVTPNPNAQINLYGAVAGPNVINGANADTYFTNTDEANCPLTYSIVADDAGTPLAPPFDTIFAISVGNIIQATEAPWPGPGPDSVFIQAINADIAVPVYQQITLQSQTCLSSTISAADSTPIDYYVEVGSTGTKQTQLFSNMFPNSDPSTCPNVRYELVTTDDDPLTGDYLTIFEIKDDGTGEYLKINEEFFTGGHRFIFVKAFSQFDNFNAHQAIRNIKVHEKCAVQTLAVGVPSYEFKAIPSGSNTLASTSTLEEFITNSRQDICEDTFKLVDTDGNDIVGDLNNIIKINSVDKTIEVSESDYTGGDIEVQLQAVTQFGEPVLIPIKITEKCHLQSLTRAYMETYEFKAVPGESESLPSAVTLTDAITNSNTDYCPATFSLVDMDGNDLALAFVQLDTADNVVKINQDAYPGGVDIDFQLKAVTEFGEAVFVPFKITERCGTQTLSISNDEPYVFEAFAHVNEILLSKTRPDQDIDNSDETKCPATYTILDQNGPVSDEFLEDIGFNSDGYIFVNQIKFEGGTIPIELKVQIETSFGTPLYKQIIIKDKCPQQTLSTNPDQVDDIKFDAIQKGYNLLRSPELASSSFRNVDPANCPVTYLVLQDGSNQNRIWGGVADLFSVNDAGYVTFNEENYLGGPIKAKLVAITPFRQPRFKDIVVTEFIPPVPKCISQTVSLKSDSPIVIQAKRYSKGSKFVSTTNVSTHFTNSDSFNCPIEYYLVTERGFPLTTLDRRTRLVTMNPEGFIEVNEEDFDGYTMYLQLKAETPLLDPVFKQIRVEVFVPILESNTVLWTLLGIGILIIVLGIGYGVMRMMRNSRKPAAQYKPVR